MTIARSVARSVASSVARSVAGSVGGTSSPYPELCNTDFSGGWTLDGVSLSAGQTDVNGGLTATQITATATTNEHRLYLSTVGSSERLLVAKAGTARYLTIAPNGLAVGSHAKFDLLAGTILNEIQNSAASIESLGEGWYLLKVTPNTAQNWFIVKMGTTEAQATPGTTFLGAGETVLISGAALAGSCLTEV